jgi:hypothetical protein
VLTFRGHQVNNTAVNLDSGNDSLLLEDFDESSAIGGFLVDGLVEQDDSRDVCGESILGGEEQLAVCATILFSVLTSNVLK